MLLPCFRRFLRRFQHRVISGHFAVRLPAFFNVFLDHKAVFLEIDLVIGDHLVSPSVHK